MTIPPLSSRSDVDYERLYERRSDKLWFSVRALVLHADNEVISDACAFAWLQLWRHRTTVRHETVVAWLRMVAVREAWRLWTEARDHNSLDATSHVDGHEDQPGIGLGYAPADPITLELQVEARAALRLVADLRPVRKRVFERHLAGLSYHEIEAEQGVTYTNVNRQIVDARREMRAAA